MDKKSGGGKRIRKRYLAFHKHRGCAGIEIYLLTESQVGKRGAIARRIWDCDEDITVCAEQAEKAIGFSLKYNDVVIMKLQRITKFNATRDLEKIDRGEFD